MTDAAVLSLSEVEPTADQASVGMSIGRSAQSPSEQYRQESRERLALLGQQLVNASIDLVFLAIWAAIAYGQNWVLHYFSAPIWVFIVGVVADVSTLVVVVSFIAKDIVTSVRQMWLKGGDR